MTTTRTNPAAIIPLYTILFLLGVIVGLLGRIVSATERSATALERAYPVEPKP